MKIKHETIPTILSPLNLSQYYPTYIVYQECIMPVVIHVTLALCSCVSTYLHTGTECTGNTDTQTGNSTFWISSRRRSALVTIKPKEIMCLKW